MEKAKKIKLFIGLFYLIFVCLFLYYFFTKFTLQEITSYDFIKNNRDYFFNLKETNLFILAFAFILFTIIWIFAAGFGSPIGIFAGFIFGKWLGTLIAIFSLCVGATLLYIFANYFLKDLIRSKFLNKYKNLEQKFKNSEFGIISCVYIFSEGFDEPKINGSVIGEKMSSDIRIVQSCLRSNRLDKSQPDKVASIIIPYNTKYDNDNDNDKLQKVIRKMGECDECIEQKMKLVEIVIPKKCDRYG